MSNIRGLSDLRRDQPNQNQARPGQPQESNPFSGGVFSLFGGAAGEQDKHPREENFWDMWKFTFCPHFRLCSFTFLLIFIEVVVFIAEAI